MTPPQSQSFDPRWTRPNVAALLALCALGLALLAVRYAARPLAVQEQVPIDPARVGAATERVNPNTASVASLRRLPNIGPARAQAIIDYRRLHAPAPFRTPSDLDAVKGIGKATVEGLAGYLTVPATPPGATTATAPAKPR